MIDKSAVLTALRSPAAKKHGLRAFAAVVAIGLLGFFALPPLLKSILVDKLGEALHRPVSVARARINPYALSLEVDGLAVQEKGGGDTVAGFDRLVANLEAVSLLRGGPVFSEIRLEGPKFKLVRFAEQRYNFSDLIDEWMGKPASHAPTPLFSLNNIQISDGSLEFDDRPLGATHVVDGVNLSLPFLSSMAYATETFVEPAFSARIDGAPFSMKGKGKPFADSLESEFVLKIDDLQLARYMGYAPAKLPIKVISGALDSDLKLVFRQQKGRHPTLDLSGTVALKQVAVDEFAGTPLLTFRRLDLSVASAELLGRKFAVERIAIDAPEIHARADRQGDINWLRLLPEPASAGQPSAKPAPAPAWSVGEAKISAGALLWLDESHGKPFRARVEAIDLDLKKLDSEGKSPAGFDLAYRVDAGEWLKIDAFAVKGGRLDLARHDLQVGEVLAKGVRVLVRRAADGALDWVKPPALRAVQASQKDTSTPWKITVAKYVGEDIGLRFEDAAVSPASTQTIDGLGFEATNLSTGPGETGGLAARFLFNRKGQVEIAGDAKLFPFSTELKVAVKGVELLPLQPYFGEKLNIAVTRGQVALDGKLALGLDRAAAGKGLSGGFAGRATIGDFQSVDKVNSADFLKWKSFHFGNIDVRHNPDSLSVGDVALADFFARVIVSPEGKLNLLQMVRRDGRAAAPAGGAPVVAGDGKAVAPPTVSIGKVTVQGGSVRFTDNFIKPNYSANLKQIGGRVSGLSSAADSSAEVDLRGSYDNVAPLSITGRINPLSAKPTLDVQADIKGLELTPLSPYAGKYAGYAIDKGKLSVSVKYKIENNRLEAENRLFVDQLTFGDPVDSPDATKLPVLLAVSLLKNRNGEIDINLPISGSLDDPQFSVGGLVVQVIVNLLVKAVTSPFALLGLASGGSGELSGVDFDYGLSVIAPPAQQRLESLAKALLDRPSLKLEIEGRADIEQDREGLKRARIDRKVRAFKREEVSDGSAAEVGAEEYPALLERVYRAEKFPKPRNLIGMVKTLPVAEMEKLMLAHSVVDDDDLRALGERRAKAVRDWLVAREVPAERLFLLPAKLDTTDAGSGNDEKTHKSRANFLLK
ncbi:MAG: DUF748 domain-containing protein [Betaproteobacteria bacterium]|nr:DUF748 domain-containing protein [Betaproteobacteria bacterium]